MIVSKKIRGFTIMEMLLALALTSMLITFSYLGLNSIYKSFVLYQKTTKDINEYTDFCKELNTLFYKSQYIFRNEKNIIFFENDNESFRLENTDKGVVVKSNNSVIDSLKIKVEKAEFYWKKELQNNNGPINIVNFNIKFYDNTFNITFEKMYDSFTLMRLDSIQKASGFE
ncbi:MAG: PulJ/GspJ family protein [Bacteroidia bacterium]